MLNDGILEAFGGLPERVFRLKDGQRKHGPHRVSPLNVASISGQSLGRQLRASQPWNEFQSPATPKSGCNMVGKCMQKGYWL
jgi:hypothetical protein